jgi:hypothetical protein
VRLHAEDHHHLVLGKEMWWLHLTVCMFASGRDIWQVWVSELMVWGQQDEVDGGFSGSDQEGMAFG